MSRGASSSRRTVAQIAPAAAVLTVFFLLPGAYFFLVSFWQIKRYKLVRETTLENYVDVVREYLPSIGFSITLALIIAAITTSFAFAIAYLIRFREGRLGTLILFVALTTLFGGYLVKIYAWKTLLGSTGIINQALMLIGVIEQPLDWLLYTPLAVVITLVHFLLPFAILPVHASLRGIADAPVDAARDLGASRFRIFAEVVLPQCETGVVTAFALTFFISVGDYVTAQLVGGPNTLMVGNFMQSQFINRLNAPIGSALAFSTLLATLIVFLALRYGFRLALGGLRR
ncbi:ABC transporter permease [Methyloligella sp. 2.7D]|uniref:ABC transporter permease n=1 Tax=unclassified Methyloligella TaxID=2625955 RepID=UPI00157C294A|nr:ABC transporter permease [Methyloligella sp. GL2]QKP77919.1 ABC transporter permease [Methyloligella sp. GL2]